MSKIKFMKCPYCLSEVADQAVKCPHCQEWLKQDAKKVVFKQEEKLKHDSSWAWWVAGLLCIFFFGSLLSNKTEDAVNKVNGTQPASSTPNVDEQRAELRKSAVENIAPDYCEASKKTTVLFEKDLISKGWPSHQKATQSGFTAEQCATIIGMLFDRGVGTGDLNSLERHSYWVGMDYMALYYSVGTPHQINRTTTAFGDSAQLVYEWSPKTVYVYIEGQKVSSYQN